jgi:hypothetical protein
MPRELICQACSTIPLLAPSNWSDSPFKVELANLEKFQIPDNYSGLAFFRFAKTIPLFSTRIGHAQWHNFYCQCANYCLEKLCWKQYHFARTPSPDPEHETRTHTHTIQPVF